MAMAAGEYVSVSSQADSEAADEQRALSESPTDEQLELAQHPRKAGLEAEARATGGRSAHGQGRARRPARDELGFADGAGAKPIVAAGASAIAFSVGAAMPTLTAYLSPRDAVVIAVPAAALAFLVALGALGAWAGGAPIVRPALRVGFWGALAMAVTAGIGTLVGKVV
jgi:VIT1/CCC1 family predicted Fe2+/Mn2+ transporter